MSKNEEMSMLLAEMEKFGREKAQMIVKSGDDGVNVEMSGSFNPLNVLAMMDGAVKSLAKAVMLEKDELLELYKLSVSKIGLDVGMVGVYLEKKLSEKEGADEQK